MSETLASCLATSHKRKRSSNHHVRFCTQPQMIIHTYSQSDYDRSGLLFDIQQNKRKKEIKDSFIFALSINFVQNDFIPPKDKARFTNKRPKLSIDTSNLSGPLYFTNMTTHHPKEEEEEESPVDLETKENTRRNSLPLL
ncbi:hypothetical protein G6F57_014558 [Rhizopus arrhizus]|uniref:Uncharacterized protein n=1 Tax=Rhizopus oryzae TaxID=64495 RepID=A0A9P6WWV7_RHIOR|nr:hypothetical protein G6F23_011873 [Rhizopus arrhizus]KAG0755176.1 hypothetical protein G6F24_012009 [Rhizopus arrhizus]KAG0756818.1 hypothetical protein G6F22_020167 [Rhizopus arrhizus]KAG0779378.1 hypothetical protein G6F21_012612 [Rhizopus arrhizus]KAG0804532.1 hypothetical protein G6F20_012622 [Rhizopus arrhizus]